VAGQAVQARLNRQLKIAELAEPSANKAEGDKAEVPLQVPQQAFPRVAGHMGSLAPAALCAAE
jgi:hypothetical protein